MPFAHKGQAQREPPAASPSTARPPRAGPSFLPPRAPSQAGRVPGLLHKEPFVWLETMPLPCMATRLCLIIKLSEAGSKGTPAELCSELLTTCHPPLILTCPQPTESTFLPGAGPVCTLERKGAGGDQGGQGGSLPLAPWAQVTAPASRALGVDVQRGTTWGEGEGGAWFGPGPPPSPRSPLRRAGGCGQPLRPARASRPHLLGRWVSLCPETQGLAPVVPVALQPLACHLPPHLCPPPRSCLCSRKGHLALWPSPPVPASLTGEPGTVSRGPSLLRYPVSTPSTHKLPLCLHQQTLRISVLESNKDKL